MQNERSKIGKGRRSYDAESKQEVIRMLVLSRSATKTSEAFGIAEKRSAATGSLSLEKNGNKKDKIE